MQPDLNLRRQRLAARLSQMVTAKPLGQLTHSVSFFFLLLIYIYMCIYIYIYIYKISDRKTTAKECSTSFDRAGYSQVKQWTPLCLKIPEWVKLRVITEVLGVHCLT